MIIFQNATRDHLAEIVLIERSSFSDPWTLRMLSTHLQPDCGNTFIVATDDDAVIGYAIARTVDGEAELLNIAITQARRGEKLGAQLLDAIVHASRTDEAREMWLEVRASNAVARSLYASHGFVQMGVRKRYYESPREDAIVLRADITSTVRKETITRAALGFSAEPLDPIPSPATHSHRQETK
ncbi:MAG: ribosomal protein S18-alanine N-acetyltransferase [Gemmatimonadaceae bacterium]